MEFTPPNPLNKPPQIHQESSHVLKGPERQRFIDKIYESGRAVFYSHLPTYQGSIFSSTGWEFFADDKAEGISTPPIRLKIISNEKRSQSCITNEVLEHCGIDSTVTFDACMERQAIMEKEKQVVIVKGLWGFGKKKVENTVDVKVGEKTVPLPFSKVTFNAEDTEQTYLISYYAPLKGFGIKGDDPRPDKYLMANIFVKKSVADEVLPLVQNDPSLIREIIRRFNPKALEFIEQNGCMPSDHRMLIVPQGVDAFEMEKVVGKDPKAIRVKPEFIIEMKN